MGNKVSDRNGEGHDVPASTGQVFSRYLSGSKWWKIRYFQGMLNDIKRRAPYYWSDWQDAWDYRVVPATVYMYFAKWVPTNIHDEN
jgi:hypothetical protein